MKKHACSNRLTKAIYFLSSKKKAGSGQDFSLRYIYNYGKKNIFCLLLRIDHGKSVGKDMLVEASDYIYVLNYVFPKKV